jgi:hypothetical protein
MPVTPGNNWFAVRTIYLFGKKQDGTNIFEERVVVFFAHTESVAFAKAEREADVYAGRFKMQWHPLQVAYVQDGDTLIDGYEVWSELYQSSEDLDSFVKSRYQRYEYHPDT